MCFVFMHTDDTKILSDLCNNACQLAQSTCMPCFFLQSDEDKGMEEALDDVLWFSVRPSVPIIIFFSVCLIRVKCACMHYTILIHVLKIPGFFFFLWSAVVVLTLGLVSGESASAAMFGCWRSSPKWKHVDDEIACSDDTEWVGAYFFFRSQFSFHVHREARWKIFPYCAQQTMRCGHWGLYRLRAWLSACITWWQSAQAALPLAPFARIRYCSAHIGKSASQRKEKSSYCRPLRVQPIHPSLKVARQSKERIWDSDLRASLWPKRCFQRLRKESIAQSPAYLKRFAWMLAGCRVDSFEFPQYVKRHRWKSAINTYPSPALKQCCPCWIPNKKRSAGVWPSK